MKNKNLWIACLSGAVLSVLVSNLPVIGLVNCVLCAGFWGSAIFAVWLYRRINGSLSMRESLSTGFFTGLLAGILGFGLSFVGVAGMQGLMNVVGLFMSPQDLQGMNDIPVWGRIVFDLFGVVFDLFFGTLGGLLGWVIFDPGRKTAKGSG